MSGVGQYLSSFELSDPIGVGDSGYLLWPILVFSILLIVLIILMYRNSGPGIKDYLPNLVPLNQVTTPLGSAEAHQILISGPGSTIAGLFNVTIGDRTNQISANITNNFTTLFGIKNSIEFQLAPSNISNPNNTAQLLVTTQALNVQRQNVTEIIHLPPLPAQKWVFIGILREGRRYDVLYNDQIVASHRLDTYPNAGIQNPFVIGTKADKNVRSPRFLGSAKHLFAFPYRMSPGDLASLRTKYVDTTGAPPIPLPFPFPIDLLSLQTFCIPGLPCKPVTQPPPNALQAWSSPYA
jgi:hypothetical protein